MFLYSLNFNICYFFSKYTLVWIVQKKRLIYFHQRFYHPWNKTKLKVSWFENILKQFLFVWNQNAVSKTFLNKHIFYNMHWNLKHTRLPESIKQTLKLKISIDMEIVSEKKLPQMWWIIENQYFSFSLRCILTETNDQQKIQKSNTSL